jgi:hypothetical protein
MPDLTMCVSKTCPLRDGCYRSTAKPFKYQSYEDFSEFLKAGIQGYECDMFIADRKTIIATTNKTDNA